MGSIEFNSAEAIARLKQLRKDVDRNIVFRLNALGAAAVREARLMHSYKDQTGNLTGSMGWVVCKGSNIVLRGGEEEAGKDEGGKGVETAERLLNELALSCTDTYTLIVCAGMQYARYVEDHGFNVLIPAEQYVKANIGKLMEKLDKMQQTAITNLHKQL